MLWRELPLSQCVRRSELRGRDFTSEAAEFKLTIPEALAKYPAPEPPGKPKDFGSEIASQQVREIIESVVKQKLDELNATTHRSSGR